MPICDCPDCIVHTCRGPNGAFRQGRLHDAVTVRNHKAKHEGRRLAARLAARAQQDVQGALSPEESAIVMATVQDESDSRSLPVRGRDRELEPPRQGLIDPKVCTSILPLVSRNLLMTRAP